MFEMIFPGPVARDEGEYLKIEARPSKGQTCSKRRKRAENVGSSLKMFPEIISIIVLLFSILSSKLIFGIYIF